jgi:hypothetical protein
VFDYPIILDLLDEAGVTWGICNMNFDSVPFGNTDNVFVFWKNFAHDQRTLGSRGRSSTTRAPAGCRRSPGWSQALPTRRTSTHRRTCRSVWACSRS